MAYRRPGLDNRRREPLSILHQQHDTTAIPVSEPCRLHDRCSGRLPTSWLTDALAWIIEGANLFQFSINNMTQRQYPSANRADCMIAVLGACQHHGLPTPWLG